VIDTDEKLDAFIPTLGTAVWVALDTEADSLHAYPERLCLIQISTAAGDELVDPLAGINLDPLLAALTEHELIMHGADYDLRLFRKHHDFVPERIFDTMLAARLLGHRQFSLTHLLTHYLGLALEKGSQKANWARRPLTERMERYARNDTHHLQPLADRLRAELQDQRRLDWHREACARLVSECAQRPAASADSAWRIKGSQTLDRPALAILRELWHWRETEAIAANLPPYFIVSHESLLELSAKAVGSPHVESVIPARLSYRRRAGLLKAIRCGLALPPEQQPEPLQRANRRFTDAERRRFRELERRRNRHAGHLGIDPTLIASRAALSDLASNWDKYAPQLMSWQRELLQP
jgi:ribonuclease D